MIICNYYRGSTDKLSGFVYDTEKKTYKEFSIQGKDWTHDVKKNNNFYTMTNTGFHMHGDIEYFFPTKADMTSRLETIKELDFVEDNAMILDFGIFKL